MLGRERERERERGWWTPCRPLTCTFYPWVEVNRCRGLVACRERIARKLDVDAPNRSTGVAMLFPSLSHHPLPQSTTLPYATSPYTPLKLPPIFSFFFSFKQKNILPKIPEKNFRKLINDSFAHNTTNFPKFLYKNWKIYRRNCLNSVIIYFSFENFLGKFLWRIFLSFACLVA